jgi:hypothetical protein
VISGYYRLISIKGCKQVNIVDAVAERVVIEDSLVSLHNLRVEAPQGAALSLRDSVIIGTNVQLSGEAALEATHSRVDLAGARLSGQRCWAAPRTFYTAIFACRISGWRM